VPGSVATTVSVPRRAKTSTRCSPRYRRLGEYAAHRAARDVRREDARNYGAWVERPTNVFKVGEKLITYAEPIGYTWKPRGDTYDFGLTTDFA